MYHIDFKFHKMIGLHEEIPILMLGRVDQRSIKVTGVKKLNKFPFITLQTT